MGTGVRRCASGLWVASLVALAVSCGGAESYYSGAAGSGGSGGAIAVMIGSAGSIGSATGAAGSAGGDTAGTVGATGAAGTIGAAGTTGGAGTGAAGTVGAAGTTGAAGAAGTTGAAGAAGAAGTKGAAGTIGAGAGTAGTVGAAGTTGAAGTLGAAGTVGAAGTTGAAGTLGAAGTVGAAGTTGAAGTSGHVVTGACAGKVHTVLAAAPSIADFETGSLFGWYDYNDGTASATLSHVAIVTPGAAVTTKASHVGGTGLNGFGTGMGFGLGCWDASAFQGITFWAKGTSGSDNNIALQVAIPATHAVADGGDCVAKCYDHPSKKVVLTSAWTQYHVKFTDLAQAGFGTPATYDGIIMALNWVSIAGPTVDISIDEIAFY